MEECYFLVSFFSMKVNQIVTSKKDSQTGIYICTLKSLTHSLSMQPFSTPGKQKTLQFSYFFWG